MTVRKKCFYKSINTLNLNVNDKYSILVNDETKYIGSPIIDTSGLLLADGSSLNNLKMLRADIIINIENMKYALTILVYDNVKINTSKQYESDLSSSVIIIQKTDESNIYEESLEQYISTMQISINKYEKVNNIPSNYDYTLQQLPTVVSNVTELMKMKFDEYGILYNYEDKLNRLIDRSTYTPFIGRSKTHYTINSDIKIHPGERFVFYLQSSNNINQNNILGQEYLMNVGGNRETIINFNKIIFIQYEVNKDGTYSDTIIGSTIINNLTLRCHDGFTVFKRTIDDGSKMGINIMDDGRVDITNMGTNSILIPQYTDSTLAENKIDKYNRIYFEFNYFNNYHIMRNDYGFLRTGTNYDEATSYFTLDSKYFICNENIWYDSTNAVFKVHIDFNRLLFANNANGIYNVRYQQMYLKEPSDDNYVFLNDVYSGCYEHKNHDEYVLGDENYLHYTYGAKYTIEELANGFDISLSGTNTILSLDVGARYRFSVKVVDDLGNIDVNHFMIMRTSMKPPIPQDPR